MVIKWIFTLAVWKCLVVSRTILNWMKKKYFCISIASFIITSLYLYNYKWDPPKAFRFEGYFEKYQRDVNPNANVGCIFPKISPFSEIAMKYHRAVPKIACAGEDWVQCNMSTCGVKKEILDRMKSIECHYKDIIYINDHRYKISDPVLVHNDEVYKLNRSDFFKVSCSAYDKTGFSLIATRWHGYISGLRPVKTPLPPPGREKSIHVQILAFDSASYNSILQKLPKSYSFLTEVLNAVVLKGYNIVGDGTPDALFPILSGKNEKEHPRARKSVLNAQFLDPDLFIFHTAKKDGYQTAYFEDTPWLGTFQYRYNGFSKQPADHYLRSFFMEEGKSGIKWWNGLKGRYCLGASPQYMFLLNLTRQFMNLDTKHFCFTFIADISHDDINLLSTADDDVVDFLRHIKESGKLEDTLLIVMGDHGPRFGEIRETYQGKIEERMAFMSLVLPETIKRQRPMALEALKGNVETLTTPFDIHTTLLDAMGLKHLASDYAVSKFALTRGLSLLEPIPKTRTCMEADIQPFWCVCLNIKWHQLDPTDPFYYRTADIVTQYINNITSEKRSLCAERKLDAIHWVSKQRSEDRTEKSEINLPSNDYYQTMVALSPGSAIYEASVQYNRNLNKFIIYDSDISRISAYSNEPDCVSATHPHLNKYCYCKNRLYHVFNMTYGI